jgi:large subunit ribosomal protein L24
MKIKTNDMVKVLTGRDRTKKGKVIQVFKADGRVVVEGVNRMTKFLKARSAETPGQKIEFFGPINASNVELVCPKCGKVTRIGTKKLANGKNVRVCKKCSETIE